jgi:hypothetical protein
MSSSVETAVIPDVRITSTWRLVATWIGASVIAVPLGVLLHELGHVLAYRAFGFQGVALHYSSSTHTVEKTFWQLVYRGDFPAAASVLPLWKAGLGTASGILITCLLTFVCCVLAAKKNPPPLAIALGIFAPVRFLSGLPIILAALANKRIRASTDEVHLALLTGMPVRLPVIAGLLVLLAAWIWMVRRIPKDHKRISLGSLLSGLALGIYVYFWVIGPRLLP